MRLSGEAYFEVAKDAAHPFVVTVSGPGGDSSEVQVLGTHFNINSYEDEGSVITTLLEGRVRVRNSGGRTAILQPGQQATINKNIALTNVEGSAAIGWKENLFLFRNATITSIAGQISRWYGLAIDYRGDISQHFNATIPQTESLDRLLQVLGETGEVHFRLKGKTLEIRP